MNELMKIDATQYGLVKTEAKQVEMAFVPMAKKLSELENEYNDIVTQKKITDELARSARNLRLIYVKVRTSTDEVHSKGKKKLLLQTRAWDGLRNLVKYASSDKESNLMKIEKHAEIREQKRIEALQDKREQELRKYGQEVFPESLGIMNDAVWVNYLAGVKANFEAQKEAEQKAEEQRLEKIRLEKLHANRKEKLMPYYQWWDRELKFTDFKMDDSYLAAFTEIDFKKLLSSLIGKKITWEDEQKRIRKENIRLEKEAKARAVQEEAQREKHDAALKKEREAKEKLEDEIRFKAEEEQAKKDAEAARIEADLNKGDSAKVKDLVADLNGLNVKYSFKSAKNIKMYAEVGLLLDKVVSHISQI